MITFKIGMKIVVEGELGVIIKFISASEGYDSDYVLLGFSPQEQLYYKIEDLQNNMEAYSD